MGSLYCSLQLHMKLQKINSIKKFAEEQFNENLVFWHYSNILKKPMCTYEKFLPPETDQ